MLQRKAPSLRIRSLSFLQGDFFFYLLPLPWLLIFSLSLLSLNFSFFFLALFPFSCAMDKPTTFSSPVSPPSALGSIS